MEEWGPLLVCVALIACGGTTREQKGSGSGGGGSDATGGAPTGGTIGAGGRPATGGTSTGGTSTGGASTGGASTGGGGAGGHAATGGSRDGGPASGGESGTGGNIATGGAAPVAPATCLIDSDCVVFEDCCSCQPAAKAAPPPGCPAAACASGACTRDGAEHPNVKCVANRCTFDRSCDSRKVTCKVAVPSCAAGTAPEILAECYTGKCIPIEHCAGVDSCGVCERAGLTCVYIEGWGATVHCVQKPLSCDTPTCGCVKPCGGCIEVGDGGLACLCLGC